MLATNDLAIYVLVVVSVQGGDAARVADPEVNGVGDCFEGDACPAYVCFDVCIQRCVLLSEIVILCRRCSQRWSVPY